LRQGWNGNNWENTYKITNDYNSNNDLTLTVRQDWDGVNWINNYQDIYTFTNNYLASYLSQSWDGADWVNTFQSTYENDQEGNITYVLSQEWGGNDWVNTGQMFFYYQIISSNSNLEQLESYFNVFPNPSNGNFTLDLSNFELQAGTIRVYNSIGQLEFFQTISNGDEKVNLDLSYFQKGVYFLQIMDENVLFYKTIQILK
jgi:hypothetical protein